MSDNAFIFKNDCSDKVRLHEEESLLGPDYSLVMTNEARLVMKYHTLYLLLNEDGHANFPLQVLILHFPDMNQINQSIHFKIGRTA